jgi:UDP-N-acetylmuramoylalanine--D-glutamate ligase
MHLPRLAAPHLGIWGFGVEGRAALSALASSYAAVTIVDERHDAPAVEPVPGTHIEWAGYQLQRLLDCDLVVVSPGVPRTHPFFAELTAKGVRTTSGSAMWLDTNAGRTVGVTGTKGKSTTSALVHHILRVAGVGGILAGNIGHPLISVPDDERLVVAELSSYQCSWIDRSPRIAVVTNLFEEHLPWHGTLRRYWADKARIATRGAEILICDTETFGKLRSADPAVDQLSPLFVQTSGHQITAPDGAALLTVGDLPPSLRARHLVASVRTAVLAAQVALGTSIPASDLIAGLREFSPLPHRLEVVEKHGGLVWVDDTLSTTPESVIAAVEAFRPNHTVLIVGGQDRGVSYEPLNNFLAADPDPVDVIAIPTNGPSSVDSFRRTRPGKVHLAADLQEAVALASRIGSPGSYVILSPGAPSFDLYRDYRHKSAAFREAVRRLQPRADEAPAEVPPRS